MLKKFSALFFYIKAILLLSIYFNIFSCLNYAWNIYEREKRNILQKENLFDVGYWRALFCVCVCVFTNERYMNTRFTWLNWKYIPLQMFQNWNGKQLGASYISALSGHCFISLFNGYVAINDIKWEWKILFLIKFECFFPQKKAETIKNAIHILAIKYV